MNAKIQYSFSAKVWQHNENGGWHFVSLPASIPKEIRSHSQWQEEGWGRLKATAAIDSSQWETAIWFDTKQNTYLLPLKSDVRKTNNIQIDKMITIKIWI